MSLGCEIAQTNAVFTTAAAVVVYVSAVSDPDSNSKQTNKYIVTGV